MENPIKMDDLGGPIYMVPPPPQRSTFFVFYWYLRGFKATLRIPPKPGSYCKTPTKFQGAKAGFLGTIPKIRKDGFDETCISLLS